MVEIPLANGKGLALVDDEDASLVTRFSWYLAHGYAITRTRRFSTFMHRLILPPAAGFEIDHINGARLDNRRCNLRLATRQQNLRNSRAKGNGFKGVSWDSVNRRWKAQIGINYRTVNLGRFATAELAAAAYDAAALDSFGDFARINGVVA